VKLNHFVHFARKYNLNHSPAAKYTVYSITVANRNIQMLGELLDLI
jgi:hypothetical protein